MAVQANARLRLSIVLVESCWAWNARQVLSILFTLDALASSCSKDWRVVEEVDWCSIMLHADEGNRDVCRGAWLDANHEGREGEFTILCNSL